MGSRDTKRIWVGYPTSLLIQPLQKGPVLGGLQALSQCPCTRWIGQSARRVLGAGRRCALTLLCLWRQPAPHPLLTHGHTFCSGWSCPQDQVKGQGLRQQPSRGPPHTDRCFQMCKMVGQAVGATEAVTGTRQAGNPGTDTTCPAYWTFVLSLPPVPSQHSRYLRLKAAFTLLRMQTPTECGCQ